MRINFAKPINEETNEEIVKPVVSAESCFLMDEDMDDDFVYDFNPKTDNSDVSSTDDSDPIFKKLRSDCNSEEGGFKKPQVSSVVKETDKIHTKLVYQNINSYFTSAKGKEIKTNSDKENLFEKVYDEFGDMDESSFLKTKKPKNSGQLKYNKLQDRIKLNFNTSQANSSREDDVPRQNTTSKIHFEMVESFGEICDAPDEKFEKSMVIKNISNTSISDFFDKDSDTLLAEMEMDVIHQKGIKERTSRHASIDASINFESFWMEPGQILDLQNKTSKIQYINLELENDVHLKRDEKGNLLVVSKAMLEESTIFVKEKEVFFLIFM